MIKQHRFPNKRATFFPSDKLFRNPHKGFTTFQRCRGDVLNENWTKEVGWKMEHIPDQESIFCGKYDDGYPDTSLAYYRIPWAYIEKEKGKYDFTFLDKVMDRADKVGQKIMLRFPPHSARPDVLEMPEWIIKELNLPERKVGDKRSPDHPLFFETYSNFIRAVGDHIDGDKRLSALDMSLVSAWGEGDQINTVKQTDWKKLVDAYMQSFKQTPISAQFNHIPSIDYANSYRPVGLRIDCLGDMEIVHMADLYPRIFAHKPDLWQKAPIAIEVGWIMKYWLDKGWDIDFIIEQSLLWHISTFNEKSARIPDCLKEKCEKWIKKMGYRHALRVIDYPDTANKGDVLHLEICVQNLGVAPIYHKYPFVIRLRGENGDVYDIKTDADIRNWMPGDFLVKTEIELPQDIGKGNYSLQVGITDGDTIVRIATDAPEQDGFIAVGKIAVE